MTSGYVHRARVRFSTDGHRAACLALGEPGQVHLEGWALTAEGPRRRLRRPLPAEGWRSYGLPVPGERLLLVTARDDRQHLELVGPDGVRSCRPVPWRVTPAPPGAGLAWGVDTRAGRTCVFRIEADLDSRDESWPSLVAESPEPLHGTGVVAGERVLFHVRRGGAAVPVAVDPAIGEVVPLELPEGVREAVPIIAAGDTVLVGVAVAGRHRLAMVSLRDPGRFTPLDALDHLEGAVQPLALHPAGTELVLRVRRGARACLLRHRFTTGHTRPVPTPPGTPGRPAAWTAAGLWLPFTSTTAPATLWWLPAGGSALRAAPGSGSAITGGRPGRVEDFPGPAGPMEAVSYGDWRHADRVVLALHGGPAERWSLTFAPALQAFALAGLAVVAPNPRGSTGYGRGYEEAINGAWGGPDLADVVAVGSFLMRERRPGGPLPAVYGTSYGAFLGLLALAEAPHLWSGCVAVAPFLSGARLYPRAAAPVRALLDRLAGTTVVNGASGPRDLLWQATRMRGRVLIVHGERDPIIPVGHSRELVAALAGRPGVSVTYRELAGGGHQPVPQSLASPQFAEIVRFLGGAAPDRLPPTVLPASGHD